MIKTKDLYKVIKKQSEYQPKAKTKLGYNFKKYGAYIMAIVPIGYLYFMILNPLLFNSEYAKNIQLAVDIIPLIIEIFFKIGATLTFIVVFLSSFGYFYQAFFQDLATDNYLSYPIKTETLIITKILFVIKNSMIFGYITFLPFLLVTYKYADINLIQKVLFVFTPIAALAICLIIASLYTLFIVFFASQFKNKKLAQFLYYFVLIGIGIGSYLLFIGLSTSFGIILDSNDLAGSFTKLSNNIGNNFALKIFNNISYLFNAPIDGIFKNDLIKYFGISLISPIILYLTLKIYSKKYIKFYLGFNEISSKSKTYNNKTLTNIKKDNDFILFTKRELNEIKRTSAYFMQGIFGGLFVGVLYSGMGTFAIINSKTVITSEFNIAILVFVQFIVIFFGAFSALPATVISREGSTFEFLKSLPINHFKIFSAKLFASYLINASILIMVVLPPLLASKADFILIIGSILVILSFAPLALYFGGVIDAIFTNLVWESPTALLKRSKNTFFNLLIEWGFLALMGFLNYTIITKSIDFSKIHENFDISLVSGTINLLFIINYVVVLTLTLIFVLLFKKLVNKRVKNFGK